MSDQPTSAQFRSAPPEIDLFKLYQVLRDNRWILLASVAVALLLAFIYLKKTPPLFVSFAVAQVQPSSASLSKLLDEKQEELDSEVIKTIEQNLSSRSLLERVVVNRELAITPAQLDLPDRPDQPYSREELANALQPHVSAALQRGTRLIAISASNRDPIVAQKIVKAVLAEYRARLSEEKIAAAEEANRDLLEEADRQKVKLQQAEEALTQYKEKTGVVSFEKTQNSIISQLNDLNSRYSEAQADRVRFEAAVGALSQLSDRSSEKLLAISAIADDPSVQAQKKAINDLEAEFANLKKRYLPKHPNYIQAESKLAELRQGLTNAAQNAAERISTLYSTAQETETMFAKNLREQEKKAFELNQMAITNEVLQREVESTRALFDAVLEKLKKTDATKSFDQDTVRIRDPANLPIHPSKPRKKLVLAVALFFGIALGLAIAALRHLLNLSLRTVDEAEQTLGLTALAAIPRTSTRSANSAKKAQLPIIHAPADLAAEGFRSLRTSLTLLNGNDAGVQVVLFTSAIPGEGKTYCASNYAASLAQQGFRTLLIDADLRLPSIQKLFFDTEQAPGLSDFLTGKKPFDAIVQTTDVSNLSIVSAGSEPGHPAELLSRFGRRRVIATASNLFDRIVIDTAPINAVSDALLLLHDANYVVLVIHAGTTPRKAVRHACRQLAEAGKAPVGFILNRISTQSGAGYYYHYGTGTYGKNTYQSAPGNSA